jgi:hypothetical protein
MRDPGDTESQSSTPSHVVVLGWPLGRDVHEIDRLFRLPRPGNADRIRDCWRSLLVLRTNLFSPDPLDPC